MRVLVIEGDKATARILESVLRDEDIGVDIAENADEAVQFARHFDYDALVLDMHNSDIRGVEALRVIRRAGIAIPLVALSGTPNVDGTVKALSAGADDYMAKPFSNAELLSRVRAVVRRSKGLSDSFIKFDDVTLDISARSVEVAGKVVPLTGKEYLVLELLSLRRGATVSKETLISHIYADGEGPESSTVGLFMHRLRKKLAAVSGGTQYIRTVRQHGYLLPRAA